jgi:hypothetical protein
MIAEPEKQRCRFDQKRLLVWREPTGIMALDKSQLFCFWN